MGLTASVFCANTGRTTTFDTVSFLAGRHCRNIVVGAPQTEMVRQHVFGTDGNLIIRGGQKTRMITILARYIGTKSAIKEMAEADKLEWNSYPVDITDDAGQVFSGMNLVDDGFQETNPTTAGGSLIAIGTPNACYAEFSFTFQQDNPGG